jgi:NarL family two-component system sensor histidine kinase YdfH
MAIFRKQATIYFMVKRLSSPVSLKGMLWGEERPFFWLLTVAMAVIYASALVSSPRIRAPISLVPFTLLMIVHTGLHWLSPQMVRGPLKRWAVWYMIGQAALAFILNLIAPGVGLLLGLYMALIAETFGILFESRWKFAAIGGYMALSLINYVLFATWRGLIWWALAFIPMTVFVAVYVSLYTRQAQARGEAQALSRKLEAANRQLTEYAAQVETLTRTAERQRMARELHDTLAQGLAGLILQLEAANSHLDSSRPERAQAIVQQAMARARTTLADARRAIDDLRAEAGAADLAAAVQAEADRFTAATGLPCEVTQALPKPLSQKAREQALRVVAEALTNVARHARASHVWVRLADGTSPAHPGGLEVEVRDDGCGFDPAAAVTPGHYGLLGLRERARLAGGTLEIASAPQQGTTVRLWLPTDEIAPGHPSALPLEGAQL